MTRLAVSIGVSLVQKRFGVCDIWEDDYGVCYYSTTTLWDVVAPSSSQPAAKNLYRSSWFAERGPSESKLPQHLAQLSLVKTEGLTAEER